MGEKTCFALFLVFSFLYLANANNNSCDVYQGSWVHDPSYPLYDSRTCPFIQYVYDCVKYGRPDSLYLQYRWQPTGCDLPRFDALDFLERHKGKKIYFIGDSISVNQFESLLCMIHAVLPDTKITEETDNTTFSTITYQDFEVVIKLHYSRFLIDVVQENIGEVLKLDAISDGDKWKDGDVLIFNNYLWWNVSDHRKKWNYIQEGNITVNDMDRLVAYNKALTTWANWVNSEVDTNKTKVIFQGINPAHMDGRDWNEPGSNCTKKKQPLPGTTYPAGLPFAHYILKTVLLGTVKKPVHLLNITTLSQLRPDAHAGPYNGNRDVDCTHWCLAGLPDTWNELLYNHLIAPN